MGLTTVSISCSLTLVRGGCTLHSAVGGVDPSPETFDNFLDVGDAPEVGV